MFPPWLAVIGVLIDFVLMAVWFRSTDQSWGAKWVISSAVMFLVRLATVLVILAWVCRHYRVSAAAVGLRPSKLFADFRWAVRVSALGALVIAAILMTGLVAAAGLGIRWPAPPESLVQFIGDWSVRKVSFLLAIGVTGTLLVVVTEELIYRSLLLPPLTSWLGIYPAVAITAFIFGLAHVIPFGQSGIPVAEMIGGAVMAAGFAIRWSVIPAMVIHALGNLFSGALVLSYVQLFKTYPTIFLGQ